MGGHSRQTGQEWRTGGLGPLCLFVQPEAAVCQSCGFAIVLFTKRHVTEQAAGNGLRD